MLNNMQYTHNQTSVWRFDLRKAIMVRQRAFEWDYIDVQAQKWLETWCKS